MPGAGPLLRADFPKAYASRLAFIRELIGPDDWPEVDSQWERYFNLVSSDRMKEEWLMYGGFGLFSEMGENDSVTYDQLLQGPSKSVTHALYGKGFQIGYLAAKHDMDGIIAKNAPELGRSLRMSVQTLAASFWNGAFATQTTADGQWYFDSDHTFIRGGGTFSNVASAALGQTALETAIVSFKKQKDLMGNPMPLRAERIVIPVDLGPTLHELLDSRLRSDTTTNASNYIWGKLTPEEWPFITSTTQWMVFSRKEDMKVFWLWNIRPETSHGFDFDKEAAKTKTLFACSFVAVDPRGSYGSTGA